MLHRMKLDPQPFSQIRSGEKTIELRLYDEKRQKIREQDEIEFSCTDGTSEPLRVTVRALHRFRDFDELYRTLPLLRCGYTKDSIAAASPADMLRYYTPEQQAKYGVVGIELQR